MKIVLSMIAWNEADVIGRAIQSCVGVIDHAVVLIDARTTDQTEQIARDVCAQHNIPCTIQRHKWVDFAANRNIVMDLSRETGCDYSLILDADEIITPNGFDKELLSHDGYNSEVEYGGQKFMSLRLIRLDRPWIWNGAIHNYLSCENLSITPNLPSLNFYHYHDGYRSKDPDKIMKDVTILKKLVRQYPNNSRYWFYYAQTLREAGMYKESIKAYKKRLDFGEWAEEMWYSMLMIATQYRIMDDFNNALIWFTKAYQYRPSRSESVYHLAVYCREKNYRHLSYMYSRMALSVSKPVSDLLFIEFDVYDYLALFEYAIAAYWVGNYKESFDSNYWLLNNVTMPQVYFEQVKKNIVFAADKLGIKAEWGNYSDGSGNRLIYYNDGMSTFGENYMKNYGFQRLALENADIEGMLWFGIYSSEEYDALLKTEKNINFHWCGSDVLYCIHDIRIAGLANKSNINFTCENEEAQKELAEAGIVASVNPMFSEKTEDYLPGDYDKVYDVAVYCHPNAELYNRELMLKVSDAMPDVKFVFFGDDTAPVSDNRDVSGWLCQDDVKSLLMSSKCYLRVTEHDGFPDLMVKAHLLGLHVITNWDFPECTVVTKDEESIISAIKNCLNTDVKKEINYFYRMSGIINNWKEIMKHGYDKFLQLQSVDQEGECGISESVSEFVEDERPSC